MQNTNEQVLDFLKNYAYGKENAKTADNIVSNLNLESGRTQEPLRDIIRGLIDGGEPIGSSSDGYYYISSESELSAVENSLKNRASETEKRAQKLRENWENKNG